MEINKVRVRFAPSPTGYLHVGGARTALINFLFGRKTGGTFILRIEDTDEARSTPEMIEAIKEGLKFIGIEWDEGPYIQSERMNLYKSNAGILLNKGLAYKCYCSVEELENRRKSSGRGSSWKYDRHCLHQSESEKSDLEKKPFAIRFHVPDGFVKWDDIIHGEMRVENKEIEDFVLIRTNGSPTYHLAVVSDDAELKITHVIRGDDHLSNTPKQILLYNALSLEPPNFAHLPLIIGADKKRFSKRHGATSLQEYERLGFLPEALLTFLASLGMNVEDNKIYSLSELLEIFSMEGLKKSSSVFDNDKLLYLNSLAIRNSDMNYLKKQISLRLKDMNISIDNNLVQTIKLLRSRAHTLSELAEMSLPFYSIEYKIDEKGISKHINETIYPHLMDFIEIIEKCPWEVSAIEAALRSFCENKGLKPANLIHPIRLLLTGKTVSPPPL